MCVLLRDTGQLCLAGHQSGLFPTDIQARESVGQERKVREQRKHETKGLRGHVHSWADEIAICLGSLQGKHSAHNAKEAEDSNCAAAGLRDVQLPWAPYAPLSFLCPSQSL